MRYFKILFFITALSLAGCAAPEPAEPASAMAFPEPGIYIVQPGDSKAIIAKRIGVSTEQLAKLNPGIDWTRIKVGQRLHYAPPN